MVRDTLIKAVISLIATSIILTVVVTIIHYFETNWWLLVFLFLSIFSFSIIYFYPTFIAPLFNTFTKIKEGDLKNRINKIAKNTQFPINNILVVDASKRSNHSNASLSGFGKKKQIVLYDNFIKNNDINEIEAIVAHEIGHYKLKHMEKMILLNISIMFVLFYLVSLIFNNNFIYVSFGFEKTIYIGLFLILIIFDIIKSISLPLKSFFSRKDEYQADIFAVKILKNKNNLINALIKINADNLSNPYPHPIYSKIYNSHPTLLERINAIEQYAITP